MFHLIMKAPETHPSNNNSTQKLTHRSIEIVHDYSKPKHDDEFKKFVLDKKIVEATKFFDMYLRKFPKTTFKEFEEKCQVLNVSNNIPFNERIKLFYKINIQVHQEASEKIRKDLYKNCYLEVQKQIDLEREYDEAKKEASRILLEKMEKIIEQKNILKKVEDRIKDKTFKILNSMDIDRAWAQGRLDPHVYSLIAPFNQFQLPKREIPMELEDGNSNILNGDYNQTLSLKDTNQECSFAHVLPHQTNLATNPCDGCKKTMTDLNAIFRENAKSWTEFSKYVKDNI